MSDHPYNPLERRPLAESVANALLEQPRAPLPPNESFPGAGIYAIYYSGDFEPYKSLLASEETRRGLPPIYVGKAIPKGSSVGTKSDGSRSGSALFARLNEHARSVADAVNLQLVDFSCRYITVDDIWIPLGENLLIERFQPVWNGQIRGFGNHDPGAGRARQRRSEWDQVHPGRRWVDERNLPPADRSSDEILEALSASGQADENRD
jgi:Eco29kI restriction endonuclease